MPEEWSELDDSERRKWRHKLEQEQHDIANELFSDEEKLEDFINQMEVALREYGASITRNAVIALRHGILLGMQNSSDQNIEVIAGCTKYVDKEDEEFFNGLEVADE